VIVRNNPRHVVSMHVCVLRHGGHGGVNVWLFLGHD
jgi:hypothetical protein